MKISAKRTAMLNHRNYAHRGLYTKDQSVPENSLQAFSLAADAGYGIELDVQLSKDGKVVVFHDDDLKRVCLVDSPVCEKTLAELKSLSLAGSDQTIPLFTEVLALLNGRVPLIIELKSGKRNKELCEKTLAILRKYDGPYCIESFDPSIVLWFRIHARDIIRGQLSMHAEHYELPKALGTLLSLCFFNFLTMPHFIAYCVEKMPLSVRLSCALGTLHVAWTSHEEKDAAGSDMVIFEYYRPEVMLP